MMISEVLSRGNKSKPRKRVGRGHGSGHGKTAGRGHKGVGQHAAGRKNILAEGGQFPLFRRIPKRGFNNAQFRTEYQVINVAVLQERFDDGAHITPSLLEESGLVRDANRPIKVLGTGDISKKLKVEATKFSVTAAKKIADAGGEAKPAGA